MTMQCTHSRLLHFTRRIVTASFSRFATTTTAHSTAAQQSSPPGSVAGVVEDGDGRLEENETDPFLKNELKKYNTGMFQP